MYKKFLQFCLVVAAFIFSGNSFSQGTWTWMNGVTATSPWDSGTYVSKGAFSAAAMPCGRYSACKWTDKNGKFWMFGGFFATNGIMLNDLWEFDPVKGSPTFNQWKWVGGDSNRFTQSSFNLSDWGTQGVPSALNKPPGKNTASAFWTDKNGDFWMFGGGRNDASGVAQAYNDLWKYNIATNQWTWMHGSNAPNPAGSYGTIHVAAPGNDPPCRVETTATWVDDNGNLWLFGGVNNIGSTSTTFVSNYLNDLWKYDPSTNMWSWEAGPNIPNQAGSYGTKGVGAATNTPDSRSAYTTWKAPGKKELWLFGGGKNLGFWGWEHYNDMWKYDIDPVSPTYQQWIWMSGKNTPSDYYGAKGPPCADSVGNIPSARMETRATWIDSCGNFWMYGGQSLLGYGDTHLGELWRYNPTANTWAFIRNAVTYAGNYGTKLVASSANDPGYKKGTAWWQNKDGFWLLGGEAAGYALSNDMMLYKPDTVIPAFTYAGGSGCTSSVVKFTETTTSACGSVKSRLWKFGDGATSTQQNPSHTYTTGTYKVVYTVTNCSGKQDSVSQSVNISGSSLALTPTSTPASCAASNGSAAVTAAGGTPAYSYTWSNAATSQTATGLAAANYTVTVSDNGACTASTVITVTSGAGFTLSFPSVTNAKCNGSADGIAAVNTSSGTSPFTYSWSNAATTQTATNLAAGTYTVSVKDATGCQSTSTVSLTAPAVINPAATNTSASCGNSNGSVSVTVTGGTGTLTYSWSNGSTLSTSAGLAAGNYGVTITDANGCSKTTSTTITNSGGPVINSITANSPACSAGGGSAVASVSGGTGTTTYAWSNGSTTVTASGLIAGVYTVTVRDANNCSTVSTVTISAPAAIMPSASQVLAAACGSANGSAVASAAGGTGSYTYTWSSGATTPTASNLSSNTYTVTVKDANACTSSTTVSIGSSGGPVATASVTSSILCNGGKGAVSVSITGTTAPYSYSWSNGSTSTTSGLTSVVNNVSSNTYTVTVTDAGGCSSTSTVALNQPAAILLATSTVSAGCGKNDGSASVTASNGVGSYTYSWSNSATGLIATNLSTAIYSVTVTDANNCSVVTTANVGSAGGPTIATSVLTAIPCNAGLGAVSVSITTPTTGPYSYNWSNGSTSTTTGFSSSISNVSADTYTVTITDAGGCSIISTVTLNQPQAIILTPTSTNAVCSSSNGSATVSVTGGTSVYTYSWSNGASSVTGSSGNSIINLPAGIFSVTVTDANGCSVTATTTVVKTGTGVINITPASQTIVEGNSVAITASGGISYTWTPAGSLSCSICSNPVASPASTTVYTVTSTDVNGCDVVAQLSITVKPACVGNDEDVFIANIFSPNGDGKNDVLYIEGNGLSNIYWAIYDRWGNIIFEAFDQLHGWDGTVKGNPMETGTYVYYLKATCIKTNSEVRLKGNVSIMK